MPFVGLVHRKGKSDTELNHKDGYHHAPVVIAILRDVPHPGQSLVSALLDDFEVPDLDT